MNKHKTKRITLLACTAAITVISAWIAVPTVAITPAGGETAIPLGQPVTISSSPLAAIGKVSVYADDKPLAVEYNLETGDLTRDFDLKPGQTVRIETKIASAIGITREFVSSFTTVEPVIVADVSVNGERLDPGRKIPPQPNFAFSFNKPVSQAAVTLNGNTIDLQIDRSDPTRAFLPPTVSLKQGAFHLFKLLVTAEDSSTLADSPEIRALVVKPLTFYGRSHYENGQLQIELDASVPFRDVEAVKAATSTTIPGASMAVEKQKIIITAAGSDPAAAYNIRIERAEGADGCFLEGPLNLTLGYQAGAAQIVADSTGSGYRGYVYNSGDSGSQAAGSTGGGASTDSGPPPGWPPCCPWPPQ
ncbi:MAG: hypothetical protein ACYDGS_08170 [Thermoleophilia bacterium]